MTDESGLLQLMLTRKTNWLERILSGNGRLNSMIVECTVAVRKEEEEKK